MQRARTPDAVYRAIGEQVARLGYDTTVFTVGDDRMHLTISYLACKPEVLRVAEKLTDLTVESYRLPLTPDGTFQRIVANGETVFDSVGVAGIAEALPRLLRPLAGQLTVMFGWHRRIIAPLVVGGEVQGLLAVAGTDLAESDVPAITTFANQAAIALESARLHKETQQLASFNESIIHSMAEGIAVLDTEGIFTFVNPAAVALLGYAPDEVLGKYWSMVVPIDQRPIVHAADGRRRQNQSDRYELEVVRKDGERIAVIIAGSPHFDEEGHFAGTMAVFTDITERKRAEEALRESEDRLSKIVRAANDGMWDWDLTTNNVYFDPRYYEMAGYVVNEFPHRLEEFQKRVHPDDIGKVMACAQKHLDGELARFAEEFRFKEKSGDWLWVMGRGVIVARDETGVPLRFVGTHTDITERKRAEEALAASERQFRELFRDNPACSFIFDREGVVQNWNRACEALYGWTAGQAIGKSMFELMVQEKNVARTRKNIAAVFEGQTFEGLEFEDVRVDGSVCIVLANEYPLRDSSGQVVYGVCAQLDITERVQAEKEHARLAIQVHEQARQMEQVLATVPEGVLLLDPEGRVLQANPVAEGDLAVLAGAKVGDILTRLGNRPLAELLTSPPIKGLWHEVKADGHIFEVIARPMENGHEAEDWVLVTNEVTREREIRAQLQQQERLAAVGQLAAGIAHDFNNILATIVLYAQMTARSEALSERDRERMAVINQQAWHATRLVAQILDFSRRAVLERRPLDLLSLLKEQVKLLERTLPEHIEITLAYGADEYTVDADPTRIQQMLMNLAVNARDAMTDGGVLRIGVERVIVAPGQSPPLPEMEFGEWIELTVVDSGTGLAPEVLPHIFEPFFTTKGPGEGSGLGLAQVYGIVKQHEGHIDVTTEVGVGTSFTLYLPAFLTQKPERPAVVVEDMPQGQGETILIVEDDATLRQALVDILEMLNYRVLEAANGREALDILEQRAGEIALALSDLIMPEMGGQALVHAMRQRGLTLPVVMLSGHLMEDALESLQRLGLAGWMLKPPDVEEIAHVLAEALGGNTG